MRKIVSELFSSVDGVVSSPDQWHGPYFCAEMGARTERPLAGSAVMLLGRRTYKEHAGFWPGATGSMAEPMNAIPKLVVTSTADALDWQNSTRLIVDPLVVGAGTRLFDDTGGGLPLRLLDTHPFETGAVALTYATGEPS